MEIKRSLPINIKPYDHQVKAVTDALNRFEVGGKGYALLFEMGCSKTLTALIIAANLYLNGLVKKVLVVAPLSVLGVWDEELKKFATFPFITCMLSGTLVNKKKQIIMFDDDNDTSLKFLIVNYESSWRLESDLLDFNADLIIADEGHKLKEGRSSQSKGMHKLGDKARYKLLLTGTVITNKEIDVFSQYRFVDPTVFGDSFFRFRNTYFEMGGYGNHIPIFKQALKDDFLKRMHSIAFRVTKDECLDLPPITEEERVIELEPKAKEIYDEIKKNSYIELKGNDEEGFREVTAANILTKYLRLSQIAGGHLTDDEHETKAISTAKLKALSEIIDLMDEENKKLVVMARFIPELNDIEEYLKSKNIPYAVVRGGVKDRQAEIDKFQNDPNCKVFVGQIAAAGLGITLTSASTMVFYSLDYSMSNFEQAKARIHRSGQTNKCHYIYLIAKDTVDKKVIKALRNKKDLAKELIDDYRMGANPFEG